MKLWKFNVFVLLAMLLGGCTGTPEKVTPVGSFELNRYLGTWYEIARLDHSFERGLNQISATYSLNDDGSVKVINRGWNEEAQQWQEAEGKAKFVESPDIAHLKVSFFGPFYGSYVVFDLKDDYSLALVSGYNTDYLWLLSRTPTIADSELQAVIKKAQAAGFDTSKLIFPFQKAK
ncbi:lipocalin family protein [Vibrio fluvialis]|uniref:lipocalin family protein n=1 Tax=Vibrio fluvialis TaxID=676 RepID=UPI001302AECF|nr:lipocalin family protein [Vibrio fluvialis]EKO3499038.1 lipocalin family protein [Vibrio fluvialis]EKO3503163.1 lipocalin family protein [Vibrio fluvialis]EKO3968679.1 lipocalin [Vibrio fluvialis]EKO3987922.1 lipocalin [Vibrio fluvialis]EKZ9000100.1 lipocalin family protein [Vibrio fluvialis]